ncbi:MAG: transposase family protein [Planctomycetaceae bacterium]|nr:transposase family protein [Planctomycetaceae bacterium]
MPDPRREQERIHHLDEILFTAICAVLCGAESWVQPAHGVWPGLQVAPGLVRSGI